MEVRSWVEGDLGQQRVGQALPGAWTNTSREERVHSPHWTRPRTGAAEFGVFLLLFGVSQGGEELGLSQ